ncbi:hypothetical protein Syun_014804 [Stephania yunnanensis]|uniref:Small auxin up regulated protein n=1 Tax=Stephania yunnanensis TaxID=152371 RepID=A0AAP0P9Y6_9MAGN
MRNSKSFSEAIGKWRKGRKGYFAVYARERKRFVVPLYYLNHPIFKVLLEMAEEEFGLAAQGPLQVPCEEELMDHIVSLIRNKKPQVGGERALVSISSKERAKKTPEQLKPNKRKGDEERRGRAKPKSREGGATKRQRAREEWRGDEEREGRGDEEWRCVFDLGERRGGKICEISFPIFSPIFPISLFSSHLSISLHQIVPYSDFFTKSCPIGISHQAVPTSGRAALLRPSAAWLPPRACLLGSSSRLPTLIVLTWLIVLSSLASPPLQPLYSLIVLSFNSHLAVSYW